MKKSKKISLNELKVKSFVTNFEKKKENTIKGGTDQNNSICWVCPIGGPGDTLDYGC